jgi:hypothetical protein
MIPVGLSDESLESVAVLFVAIGDGLKIFVREVGEEPFEEKLCVLPCFGASKVLEKGLSELLCKRQSKIVALSGEFSAVEKCSAVVADLRIFGYFLGDFYRFPPFLPFSLIPTHATRYGTLD